MYESVVRTRVLDMSVALVGILLLLAGCAHRSRAVWRPVQAPPPAVATPLPPPPPLSLESEVEQLRQSCLGGSLSSCSALSTELVKWHTLTLTDRVRVAEMTCRLQRSQCPFYGRLLTTVGRVDEARRICTGTCSRASWSAQGCLCLGAIANYDMDHTGAREFFDIGCAGGITQLCLMVGLASHSTGDFEGAASIFRRLCAGGDQASAYACMALGWIDYHWEDFEAAIGHLRRAVAAGILEAHVSIAKIHAARGDWSQAESTLQTQCRTNRSASACGLLGALRYRLGDLSGAGAHFVEACSIAEEPCGSGALFAMVHGGMPKADVLRTLRRGCEGQAGCYGLAVAEAFYGNDGAALRTAEQACKRNDWNSCSLLALLSNRTGESDNIVARLSRMCSRNQSGACANLALIHLRGGRSELARDTATKACNLDRSSCGTLALVLYRGRDRRGAQRELNRACVHGAWAACMEHDVLSGRGPVARRTARSILGAACRAEKYPELSMSCLLTGRGRRRR